MLQELDEKIKIAEKVILNNSVIFLLFKYVMALKVKTWCCK